MGMADKRLVLANFDSETAADRAAGQLGRWGKTSQDVKLNARLTELGARAEAHATSEAVLEEAAKEAPAEAKATTKHIRTMS
jgi:hypothetical protein